jgi:hypothetical protein
MSWNASPKNKLRSGRKRKGQSNCEKAWLLKRATSVSAKSSAKQVGEVLQEAKCLSQGAWSGQHKELNKKLNSLRLKRKCEGQAQRQLVPPERAMALKLTRLL